MKRTMTIEWLLLGWIALAASMLAGSAFAQGVDTTDVRRVQPMMEGWKFVQDDDLTDAVALASSTENWQAVTLPHTWNAEDAATPGSEDYERGLGWYRLEFPTPESGVRHWLEFGAASLVADVWLNGEHLGQHSGGFTAFRFDITEVLVPEGPNVLLVKVDNSIPQESSDPTAIAPLGGDFNKSGGLYRHVSLISTPAVAHFDLADLGGPGVYASSSSVTEAGATVNARAKLTNNGDAPADYTAHFTLVDAEGAAAASAEQPVTLDPGGELEVSQDLAVDAPHLWQGVEDPYLYQLVAELVGPEGTPADRVVQSFGIREMRFDPTEGFFLNGRHVRLHGVAIHQDFQGKGWAVTDADVDASLALVMEIGANAIRLGHYPFSQYTLQRVSELGLVAWAEKPSGVRSNVDTCTPADPAAAFVENAVLQLRETIRQQYNHAAVAVWSIGNETSAGQIGCDEPYDDVTPLLRTLHAAAKEEDPTRPTVYSEFPHPAERSGPFATERITDLFATNRYFLWYHEPLEDLSPLLDTLHELAAGQPLAVSEYGAGSAIDQHTDNPLGGLPEVHSADDDAVSSFQPEEYASYVHEQVYPILESKPYLWGTFVWNMFDFGSTNRNEGGTISINTKGLVTFDRQTRKDPFFYYKANWSSEPVTYITSRRYTDRAYAVTDVKVYSNADTVELSVNGVPAGSLTSADCEQMTCVFEDVELARGANTVTASGNHAGELVADSMEWTFDEEGVNIAAGYLATGYVAADGTRFGSDEFFTGGAGAQIESGDAAGGIPEGITGTDDPQLYKYSRQGEFSYEIPVPDGEYEVTLGFLEPDEDAEPGDRVFNVVANGESALERYEVLEHAGAPLTAVNASFPVTVEGGMLVLDFVPVEGDAMVSTIRIAGAAQ